jgi:predicted ATPase/tetratricopeptide (TPR) repeat protein/transcriptional regulator with XRE-family HTH domain
MQRDSEFGAWLKGRRKSLDLTQAELASQVGCAVVTVKKIETAAQRPSKQMAERLAKVLAIPALEAAAFVAFARGLRATPPRMPASGVGAALAAHLPSPPTAFVGRSQELPQLMQLLDDPSCRLVTLVGLGGIGKTRLAIEAAQRQTAKLAQGAHFVSLALAGSADELLFACGEVLEFSFDGPQKPFDQLIHFLRDKTLLLLLDGFEHLLAARPLLAELLAGAPGLKLLITSRERLNVPGEWALPIEGMTYPQEAVAGSLEDYAAVRLFAQSARRALPRFSLSANAREVLRICQLVDGTPLALELAAVWVRLLPCAEIAERLTTGLDLLASPAPNAPERHRSLRRVFDQSWVLLASAEQLALAKLSVLRGAIDLEAAAEVGGASLPVVASLADKSLLGADGTGRYTLHELLRQYAAEQLAHLEAAPEHRRRAIDYLRRTAERASGAAAHREAAARLGQAIAIAEEVGDPDLLGRLHHARAQALLKVALWLEARPELEATLRLTETANTDQRVQALLELAEVSFFVHDLAGQRRLVGEALALAEAAQRNDLAVAVMVKQGWVETNDGKLQEAVSIYQRAVALGAEAEYDLGRSLYWQGRYREALATMRRAVELQQGNPVNLIWPLQDLGLILSANGRYAEAMQALDESRRLCREHESWPAEARSVANRAGCHLDVFDYAGSEALGEEARELARKADFVLSAVSAGIDLLFNYARRQAPERAEKLISEVMAAVEQASGSHGWLWHLRLAQAQAELALARGEWDEAVQLAETAFQNSCDRGRAKYQTLGLVTRARGLAALGRTREAMGDFLKALGVARPTGDPILFLRAAAGLLAVEGDPALAGEALGAAQRIRAALPNDAMRRSFEAAEPVQTVVRWR